MATNFPGPYEIRLYYTTIVAAVAIQHSARYNLRLATDPDPGTAFADIDALRRDDSPFALDGEIDDWVTLMQGIYNNSTGVSSIDYAELWGYEPESFDAHFISTYPINVAGSVATSITAYGQAIVTFRTTLGGIMKLNFMECVIGIGGIDTLPFSNANLDTLADAVVAGTVPWMARDNGYPFACIALYPGQSEALFKRRVR